jgi:hypothetical protein
MDAPLMLQDVLALVDCGSLIVRQCERRDLGNARLSSSSLRSAVDESLDSVEVIADAESAGKLLRRLPSLRQLQTDRQAASKGCSGAWTCKVEVEHVAAP